MKAYTVYQPYAWATVIGLKHYETRPRRTNIRGRVAVHAAKEINKGDRVYMDIISSTGMVEFADQVCRKRRPEEYGAIIGTVEIVDCVPVEEIMDKLTPLERALGDYSPGRFAWVLKNPFMFSAPIPASGQQGWWNWPFAVIECPSQIGPTERPNYKIVCGFEEVNDKKEGSQ